MAEEPLDDFLARFLTLVFIADSLRLKAHGLLDGGKLPIGERQRPPPDGVRQRLIGHKQVDNAAIERFGGALQALQGETSVDFPKLHLGDARLAHAESLRELRHSHAETFADRAYPSAGGSRRERQEPQFAEALVDLSVSFNHTIIYRL